MNLLIEHTNRVFFCLFCFKYTYTLSVSKLNDTFGKILSRRYKSMGQSLKLDSLQDDGAIAHFSL